MSTNEASEARIIRCEGLNEFLSVIKRCQVNIAEEGENDASEQKIFLCIERANGRYPNCPYSVLVEPLEYEMFGVRENGEHLHESSPAATAHATAEPGTHAIVEGTVGGTKEEQQMGTTIKEEAIVNQERTPSCADSELHEKLPFQVSSSEMSPGKGKLTCTLLRACQSQEECALVLNEYYVACTGKAKDAEKSYYRCLLYPSCKFFVIKVESNNSLYASGEHNHPLPSARDSSPRKGKNVEKEEMNESTSRRIAEQIMRLHSSPSSICTVSSTAAESQKAADGCKKAKRKRSSIECDDGRSGSCGLSEEGLSTAANLAEYAEEPTASVSGNAEVDALIANCTAAVPLVNRELFQLTEKVDDLERTLNEMGLGLVFKKDVVLVVCPNEESVFHRQGRWLLFEDQRDSILMAEFSKQAYTRKEKWSKKKWKTFFARFRRKCNAYFPKDAH